MFKTIKRIIEWCQNYKKQLYLGFICAFFTTGFSAMPIMIASYTLGKVVEHTRYGGKFDYSLIWKSLSIMLVLLFFRFLFSYWRAKLQESIGYEIAANQRIKIGNILKRVSLGYFQENSAGDILSTITTELSAVEYQGMRMVNEVVNGYINVVVIIICLAIFNIWASIIALVGVLFSALFLHFVSKESEKNAPYNEQAVEALSSAIIEYVRGLPIVKSFGQEGASIDSIKRASEESKRINIKIEKGFTPYNCLHLFSLNVASVGLVFIASWMTFNRVMDFSTMIMFCMFSFIIFGSVESINNSAHVLGVIDSGLNKLERIEKAEYIDETGKNIDVSNYNIEFLNVSFGYDNREVLHDISFTIPEGKVTAIVGASGSGKSTICNLITRFYNVKNGSIKIGGIDVKEFTCDSLLKNISMVFQNVYLFHDTIKNNIRFGNPNASEEEIIDAAKRAKCHDFIMELPNGYETIVNEAGASLSGGEKQRISIARAILKNAPIIILDEATASIDPENEHLIQSAISELTKGKTIIVIAHRLATIQNADQILVVNDGKIEQSGTHLELIGMYGTYKKFVEIREKSESWKI